MGDSWDHQEDDVDIVDVETASRDYAVVASAFFDRQRPDGRTPQSFRFHNKNFDEMRCKLDSTENPRSFEKYPTPP